MALTSSFKSTPPWVTFGAGAAAGALAAFALLRARPARAVPALPAFAEVVGPEAAARGADEAAAEALKARIRGHYDDASASYQQLWGQHVHHGLWRPGSEGLSKEEAQLRLVEDLYARAGLARGAKVLDVGCGVGGTSVWLANRGHAVTGITLSPVQAAMAQENLARSGAAGAKVRFLVMDGEKIDFPGEDGTFDAIWITEVLSHMPHKDRFFAHASRLLKPGGKLVLADWFAADCVGTAAWSGVLSQIETGMMSPISTVTSYQNLMVAARLRPIFLEDVSPFVAKTWDLSLALVSNPETWNLARRLGADAIAFLQAFGAMKDGYASGMFRLCMVIAEKATPEQLASA